MTKTVFFLFIVFLTGCQSLPSHDVKGTLDKGVYTSKAFNFSVEVPFDESHPSYPHMHIKEEIGSQHQYQSFGPAMFDRRIFRLLVSPKTDTSQPIDFEQTKQNIFNSFIAQAEQAYKAKAELISEYKSTINGHQATSRLYKQPHGRDDSFPVYQSLDFVNYPNHYVFFWAETPLGWQKQGEEVIAEKKLEKQLLERTDKRQNDFISSFKFLEKH